MPHCIMHMRKIARDIAATKATALVKKIHSLVYCDTYGMPACA